VISLNVKINKNTNPYLFQRLYTPYNFLMAKRKKNLLASNLFIFI
jgi:hypothetical protein